MLSAAKTYLIKLYLKNFFITLLGLEIFFLLIDFLQNQKNIPNSTNLTILYFYYQTFAALKITLALSLIFGAIWSYLYLVRSNELTALESSGMSKREVIRPMFWTAFTIAILYMFLGLTKAGYYYDDARAILKDTKQSTRAGDLFFRYENEFIYIKSLNPLSKTAEDIKIIGMEKNSVKYVIEAKTGTFENDGWTLKNTKTMLINENATPPITKQEQKEVRTLEGFKPKILDNISQNNEGLNIVDAISAIILLQGQKLSIEKIKAALFSALSLPLFAPFFIVLIGYFTPVASRGFLYARYAAVWIFTALCSWGVLITLSKLSYYGPIGSYAPMSATLALGAYAFYLFRRLS
jgi:lipopolysaccharide export system permease protein